MDPISLVFVALMILMTGIMAWAGDQLGRNLGKKRVKLGPLRPKHTAALLTALAGSGGALILVLILMAVAEPVRVWIISGTQVKNDLDRTRKDLEAAQARLKESAAESININKKLLEQDQKLAKSIADGSKLTSDNQKLALTSTELRKQIADQQVKAAKTLEEAKKAQAGLLKAEAEVKDLEKAADTIKKNNVDVAKENLRLTMANANLEQTAEDLKAVRTKLEAETKDLKDSISRLQENFEATSEVQREQLRDAQRLLDAAETELQRSGAVLEAIQSDVARLQRERVSLMNLGEAARTRPMVASLGDELTRIPVGANLTIVEAQNLMKAAEEKAAQSAKARGAGLGPASSYAQFIDLRPAGQQILTAEAQKQGMIRLMAGGPQPRILIIKSLYNAFQGEFIPLAGELYENPVIFKEDQLISEFRLNGAATQEAIASELATYVEQKLSPILRSSGLIPVAGSSQPFGEVPRETVVRIVQEIKSRGVSVRVQFLSAAETRAGDPFRLAWRLR